MIQEKRKVLFNLRKNSKIMQNKKKMEKYVATTSKAQINYKY